MGRLENIIARNRRPHGLRASVGMVWRGLLLLLLIVALLFTDWAIPDAPKTPPSARPPDPAERRLDGVPVLRSAPRPAARPDPRPEAR